MVAAGRLLLVALVRGHGSGVVLEGAQLDEVAVERQGRRLGVPDEAVHPVAQERSLEDFPRIGPEIRRVGALDQRREERIVGRRGRGLAAPEEVDELVLVEVGCSAMPSNPRSEKLLTPRSRIVAPMTPSSSRRTWPVFFSMTSHSSSERNARPMGVMKPPAAVRTARLGTVMVGAGGSCARPTRGTSMLAAASSHTETDRARCGRPRRACVIWKPPWNERSVHAAGASGGSETAQQKSSRDRQRSRKVARYLAAAPGAPRRRPRADAQRHGRGRGPRRHRGRLEAPAACRPT